MGLIMAPFFPLPGGEVWFWLIASGLLHTGYKLFLAMPSREQGTGKFELPGGVSIHISRVGPGVFFSLFGAVILALSFHYGVTVDGPGAHLVGVQNPQSAGIETAKAGTAPGRATFSGVSAGTAVEPDASQITALEFDVARLNRAEIALDPSLDRFARGDIQRSLRAAKLALMLSGWSEAQWGDRSAFRSWLDNGEPMPPPDPIAGAVAVWRGGQ